MLPKQQYQTWQTIAHTIRPIWQAANGKVRGNKDLWRIIHGIDKQAWQDLAGIVPGLREQHEWLFKRNAVTIDQDLHEILLRIRRKDAVTQPWNVEYNLPAFRCVMSIKDIIFDIEDHARHIEFDDDIWTTAPEPDQDRRMWADEHDAFSKACWAYHTAITAFRDIGLDHEADKLEPGYRVITEAFEARLAEHDRASER